MNQHATNRRQFLRVSAGAFGSLSIAQDIVPKSPIVIDLGRQLFVDNYLIAQTNLRRSFHKPRLHEAGPVLKPETPLEMNDGVAPVACPFQDGVFFDPKDRLYKIWYMAGWHGSTAYAYSEDGIRWVRPKLDVVPGTNLVMPARPPYTRDGSGIWLDQATQNPAERFKMMIHASGGPTPSPGGALYTSPDGIHWTDRGISTAKSNSNFWYDPFRKSWFYSLRLEKRDGNERMRIRNSRETPNFLSGATWIAGEEKFLAEADSQDLPDPVFRYPTQIYNVDAVGYESLMLGVFAIHRGPPNEICAAGGFPKITDLTLAYSRDGLRWDRPDRSSFIECSRKPGTWNRGYLHAASGVCVIAGDELRFYFGAFSGISPKQGGNLYAGGSTGLATLRRDGFCSMDAGDALGTLATRPLQFKGRYLFVNANAKGGDLKVEVLGPDGKAIPGFSADDCQPVRSDSTRQQVRWKRTADLTSLRDRPVSLRFHAARAQLFSFWISPEQSGASHGYVAAGGPGFTGPTDTVGGRA